ncbi:SEP-domain-containing protein [Boletus edulis BED1]|uniref:SEP-domain-containing protein n=1 Tax=Boletus edulis BED1 TaxID=1328754 RepID=A0AAD4BJC1_BOLED|nr:SEP-domain-containing protein [Boletus edulis BED1]
MESSNTGIPRLPIAHDDDDDDDDDEGSPREGESWFAGGERSGISVQNPNARGNVPGGRMVQDILRRAAEMSAARTSQPSADHDSSTAFRGGGHTLGSDDVESTFVPDPDVQLDDEEEEAARRNITFWHNGFSIEGGAFYSYADPENERLLAEINTGRAPVSVLNVRPGQPVEVVVSKRTDEDYVPEKRPFGGSGNRLGSPVPAVTTNMPGSFPTGPSAPAPASRSTERASVTTVFEVDQTQPMTTVQIRLADGTRMPCRMNLTHTVGDIRYFINASRPENTMRPYTIGTTFPNRVLDNDQVTIQSAGLANSVVVQRWV